MRTEPLLVLGVLAAAAVAYAQTRAFKTRADAADAGADVTTATATPAPAPGFWASLSGRGRSKPRAVSNMHNKTRQHVYLLPSSFRVALEATVDASIPEEVKVRGARVKTEASDADVDAVVADAVRRLNAGGLQFKMTALVAYAKETNSSMDSFYAVDFVAYEATTHQSIRLSLASIVDQQQRIFVHSLRPWNDGILEPTGEGNTGSPECGPYEALAAYAPPPPNMAPKYKSS